MATRFNGQSAAAFASAALMCLGVVSSAAQERQPPFVETMDVVVTEVEVIVTDREGTRVAGLTAEDFSLFLDGQPQAITNFFEVRSEAMAPPPAAPENADESAVRPRPQLIAIFIDLSTINRSQQAHIASDIVRFLTETLRPQDRALLAIWSTHLEIVVPITGDEAAISDAIVRVLADPVATPRQGTGLPARGEAESNERRVGAGGRQAIYPEEIRNSNTDMVQGSLAHDIRMEVRRKSAALERLASMIAGFEGRKSLLFVARQFPICAVPDATRCPPEADLSSIVAQAVGAANASGATIYSLYSSPAADYMFSADKGGRDLNGNIIQPPPDDQRFVAAHAEDLNSMDALARLARSTGGVLGTGPIVGDFYETIQADGGSYYSLGFRASQDRTDRTRKIRVVPRDKALRVRVREAVVQKAPATAKRDELVTQVLTDAGGFDGRASLDVRVGRPTHRARRRHQRRVEITIPGGMLTFLPRDGKYVGEFGIQLVALDSKNNLSDVIDRRQRVEVASNDLAAAVLGGHQYILDLELRDSTTRLAISATDSISALSSSVVIDLKRF